MDKMVEISEETLRGVYLILCGISFDHSGAEVYPKAVPIMTKAHHDIIKLGEDFDFDCRGEDL
jgi:hypothetical protein